MCLTRDALVRLLDNHGPDFGEQWELPVCVKLNPGKGTASSTQAVMLEVSLIRANVGFAFNG